MSKLLKYWKWVNKHAVQKISMNSDLVLTETISFKDNKIVITAEKTAKDCPRKVTSHITYDNDFILMLANIIKEKETHLTRLHGWLTSDCRYIPIHNSHVDTIYDEELKQKEKDIKSLYRKKLSWEKIYDGLIFKKNWIKLNAECYGICYSENLITKEQIEWLCKHRNIMTRQQKECLKEINDLKGK